MAFDCSECGYRSNEVKGGGGIPDMGQTFTLLCESEDDLARDVLKVRKKKPVPSRVRVI
jgi:zinc finger protein